MDFSLLLNNILQTHSALQRSAVKAINRHITIRNWLIGYYIVEFEQKGEDRATYGTQLLTELAAALSEKSISNVHERELRRYRLFYQTYTYLATAFSSFLNSELKWDTFPVLNEYLIRGTSPELKVPAGKIIAKLSYSHLVELMSIADPLKRTFYELECIKGNWSTRELRRQIHSLYFEQSGLSQHPEKLSAMVRANAEVETPLEIVKSVYTFEFLGLKAKEVVEESDLETALLDHLQEFMLELGRGFCLEGRQKRILIGDEYFFVDLVFYHRILKCHVLLELKVGEFNHVNAGQLNTYLNYYKAEVSCEDDNPPVGILLVTNKNEALVQYATAGMDNNLFVSKYLVELPGRKQLEEFMKHELSQF